MEEAVTVVQERGEAGDLGDGSYWDGEKSLILDVLQVGHP